MPVRRTFLGAWTSDTDLILDEGCEREVVEQISKVSPHVRVAVFPQAFVVEAVHLRDLPRLVVAAQDGDAVAVAQLEGDKESDRLYGVVSSVDVITHEEVVCVW